MRFRDERTELIDLNKRTVIPGLNDSHLHLIRGGLNLQPGASLGRRSIAGGRPAYASASRRKERPRGNGCAWWADGPSFSSPSVGCRHSTN